MEALERFCCDKQYAGTTAAATANLLREFALCICRDARFAENYRVYYQELPQSHTADVNTNSHIAS